MTSIYLFTTLLLVGMLLALEAGRRIGRRHLRDDPEGAGKGVGALESAVFALFGLLLAFTFSGASTRFDHRRDLIVQEANAIGTAYLRLDLLPAAAQAELRPLFRQYVESRLATFRNMDDEAATQNEWARDQELQNQIWKKTISAIQGVGYSAVSVSVVTSLNDMIDITSTRLGATRTHPPDVVFGMLFLLGLASSLLAGYGMAMSRTRQWTHVLAFAVVITATVYVILDIEYPRLGLVRVDSADRILVDLLHSMK